MTEKADVGTGELEVLVRYVGAEERYTVSGSPVPGVARTITR
jgi:hypothetical protein